MVKETADEVAPGLTIETCGSHRRLKSSCGDIDMLMTFKDGRRHIHETGSCTTYWSTKRNW